MENTKHSESESDPTPILRALRFVEKRSTGEVRVHVVKKAFEKDPTDSALKLFEEFQMTRTQHRNAILIYLNRSTRRFAIIADEGIHRALGQRYWDELGVNFAEDLQSTHFENALALAIFAVGTTLSKKFPRINF